MENPCLWMAGVPATSSALDVDSLGLYDDPPTYQYQIETAGKMEIVLEELS